MPANHVILYAVYAIDGNQNGSPDFNDDAVHVRYHGNNNVSEDVICPHHHVAGATAKLSANGKVYGKKLAHDAPASAAGESIENYTFTYGDNIFIGWSTTPILNQVIASKAEYETLKDSIKTEVKLLVKPGPDVSAEEAKDTGKYADADGNTNVYAVWAADRNKNKTADYLEEHGLAYADNAISGNVTGMPAASVGHISKDTVKLTGKPGHSEVDNKKVAFIGWTATATDKIYSCTDEAPEMITEVTFADADITVYAAWGYDEDNDGTADVLETYSFTYDLNGGSGNVPAVQSGIKKGAQVPLTMEKDFTRNDKEVFAGWSYTKNESAFTADQEADVYEILITDTEIVMEPKDITLYAVWAVDQDDDGKPDYSAIYTVTYNLNGGSGDADYGQETVKRGVLHKVREAPSREGFEFLCWKDDDGTEHQPGKQVTVTGNLTLTAQWKENDPAPEPDTGNLTVSTTVAGNAADAQKEFHFTVTLGDTAVNGVYGDMEFTEGVSTFTLKHSESKTATGLPAGITYEVAETEADQDGYVTSKTGDTGTIEKDVTSTAAFTNTKNVAPVDPNKPTSPENPVEPDKPTNPENPVEPDKPANPENPVEPDKPSNPENPDKPINPGNPVEPDKPAEPKKPTDDVPKTGDETNLALWLALLGIPGIGVIAALLGSKRKYRGKHSKR